ncbi:hypothetical protein BN7_4929 [Wickerhamomyces ciferrii]|uniref:Uncharacterized protein n=1 Tax=Wickerhamomyces ciferrii (strain ATCC 14091 / BCRC 22168 / CBS 111 / JCM 3599 / NBRC 0793 / NRRL Y-1031 F-60-10) TaxID=1206466 RepID=K0KTK3_WICCF|nr:uncharacterized protein BN7_4929 [Wickerhamomyces ciferrii]CCH45347.1 hypothetical protein BN7_4929 [Wickerhamomyces ciferrii]
MSLWNAKDADGFPQAPILPELSRDVCLNPKGLRSFLQLSRANTDDVVKQRLNSLLNSGKRPKEELCEEFTHGIMYKSWKDRLSAIEYCNGQSVELEREIESHQEAELQGKDIDPRIDPYAAADFQELKNSKYNQLRQLQNWVKNEKLIEDIVQNRSTGILNDVCVSSRLANQFQDWSASQK